MVQVLIVDDSSFVRRSLSSLLEKDPDIRVVGLASNGQEGVELARKLDPDVITMDVEMPRMDGLTALKHIMAENPCPVIMVSSLTTEGADITLKAMDLGALDFMPKLSSGSMQNVEGLEKELSGKVKALARRKAFMRLVFRREREKDPLVAKKSGPDAGCTGNPGNTLSAKPQPKRTAGLRTIFDVVAIGVSTGGPPAVQKVLSCLPGNFPVPILIAQHMPASFTGPFAKRLDGQCAISVKEASNQEPLRAGTVYICPGGKHLRLEKSKAGLLVAGVSEEPKDALYKPSANELMGSVGMLLGRRGLGVTLTGMGNDGLIGTKLLKEKGGWAIAQNESSCVVYGMPKAVVDAGLADEVVDLSDMANAIMAHFTIK